MPFAHLLETWKRKGKKSGEWKMKGKEKRDVQNVPSLNFVL